MRGRQGTTKHFLMELEGRVEELNIQLQESEEKRLQKQLAAATAEATEEATAEATKERKQAENENCKIERAVGTQVEEPAPQPSELDVSRRGVGAPYSPSRVPLSGARFRGDRAVIWSRLSSPGRLQPVSDSLGCHIRVWSEASWGPVGALLSDF